MMVWMSLITYGAGDTIGLSTQLFTLEGKLSYHPELQKLRSKIEQIEGAIDAIAKRMKNEIATALEIFGDTFHLQRACEYIKKDKHMTP
mmetsp:Transcript_11356/g.21259  ORF Transcript_11356/g.21259 Transcript_11356/m.21259 type:complete len:89 (+) Transcript_11356:642-908(+)